MDEAASRLAQMLLYGRCMAAVWRLNRGCIKVVWGFVWSCCGDAGVRLPAGRLCVGKGKGGAGGWDGMGW